MVVKLRTVKKTMPQLTAMDALVSLRATQLVAVTTIDAGKAYKSGIVFDRIS